MNPSLIWLNSNVDSNMEKDLWAVEFSNAYCELQKEYQKYRNTGPYIPVIELNTTIP